MSKREPCCIVPYAFLGSGQERGGIPKDRDGRRRKLPADELKRSHAEQEYKSERLEIQGFARISSDLMISP